MTAGQAGPAPDRASSSCAAHPVHPDRRGAESVRICVICGFDSPLERDAGGNVLSYRLFDAWGNEQSSGGEPYGYRARYGYYADGETGLIALAFRYYAPGVGRFLNRDPIRVRGSVNLMRYADSDPVTRADPHGLQAVPAWLPFFGGGVAVFAGLCVAAYLITRPTKPKPAPPMTKPWDSWTCDLTIQPNDEENNDSQKDEFGEYCMGCFVKCQDECTTKYSAQKQCYDRCDERLNQCTSRIDSGYRPGSF